MIHHIKFIFYGYNETLWNTLKKIDLHFVVFPIFTYIFVIIKYFFSYKDRCICLFNTNQESYRNVLNTEQEKYFKQINFKN